MPTQGFKASVIDIATGFVSLCVFIGAVALTRASFDARLMLIVAALVFFSAGLLRSAPSQDAGWRKAVRVGALPGTIVLLLHANGNAFSDRAVTVILILIIGGMSMSGVQCGRSWASRSHEAALAMACVPIAFVVLIAALFVPRMMARSMGKTINEAAPPFSIASADGSVVDSARMKGHVVVLAFWATWCSPCRQELPRLQQALAPYRGSRDVEIWAVGGPWGEDTLDAERRYAEQQRLTLPLAFDAKRSASEALRIHGFPALTVLDKAGRLRFVHTGYDASDPFIRELPGTIDALR